jgi:hypothetical protein
MRLVYKEDDMEKTMVVRELRMPGPLAEKVKETAAGMGLRQADVLRAALSMGLAHMEKETKGKEVECQTL